MCNNEKIIEFYFAHKGEVIGGTVGLIVSLLILIIGFIKLVFIVMCITIGYYIGKKLVQDKEYLKKLLDRILPPGTYR